MTRKYYCRAGYRDSEQKIEFSEFEETKMLEWYREQIVEWERKPTVIFGTLLEFEPAEIIKSFRVKDQPDD